MDREPIPYEGAENVLFESKNWRVILHDNQSYLGRTKVALKSRALEDPLQLTDEERDELWKEVLPKLAKAVAGTFHPTRLNYAHLANATKHVHWHVVPRYEDPPEREFAGHTFIDENVGHNFAPSPRVKIPDSVIDGVYSELKKRLE